MYIYIYKNMKNNTYIHICIDFHILFHYGLSQDIGYSALCYTVGLVVYPFYI